MHRRHVELRVVGEDAHRIARAEIAAELVEHRCRPVDHHLVGHREAAAVANTSRASHTVTR